MKADSDSKLIKVSSVIADIYGDTLHKKRQLSFWHKTHATKVLRLPSLCIGLTKPSLLCHDDNSLIVEQGVL